MKIRDAGITSIAISATFSPLTTECEVRAAEIVRSGSSPTHVSRSPIRLAASGFWSGKMSPC